MTSGLALVLHHDPRLRVVCGAVTDFDAARVLAAGMLHTMYAAGGRGLAAPQVGRTCRVIVMDADWKAGPPAPRVLFNPLIVARSADLAANDEGCLSLPGQPRRIARPAAIGLRWQDDAGAACAADFTGIQAVILQHEIDHLDGILILDHPEAPADPVAPGPDPAA